MNQTSESACFAPCDKKEMLTRILSIKGEPLTYRLWEAAQTPPVFLVEAEYCGERAVAGLGADLPRAAAIFDALLRGGVTPCTLFDVVRDLMALQNRNFMLY